MLELTDLQKRYDDVVALDGMNLQAQRGRILGFLGPNGAGKTTSMRSIFGLVDLDAGTVSWDDEPITVTSRMRFGYMPEERGLYRRMAAGRQLAFMGELHGMARTDAQAAATQWLERLGLGDRVDDVVSDLSHGNQQRVQLAASLVHDPELLVLDEPFSGLDPLGVADMTEMLRECAARGAAVVFSSHQLDLVEDVVDDVVIVAHGRNLQQGTLSQVRASTGTTMVTFQLDTDAPDTLELPDGTVLQVHHERERRASAAVPTGTDPATVLQVVQQVGTVLQFGFEPPTLAAVFRDVVGMSLTEVEAAETPTNAAVPT